MSSKIDPQKYELFTEKQITEKSENFIIVTKTFIYKRKPEKNDGLQPPKSKQVADYILSLEGSSSNSNNNLTNSTESETSDDSGTICDAVSGVSTFVLDKNDRNTNAFKNYDIPNQDTPKFRKLQDLLRKAQDDQKIISSFKIPKTPVKIAPRKIMTLPVKSTQKLKPIRINVNKFTREVRKLQEGQKWHNQYLSVAQGSSSRGLRLRKRQTRLLTKN